MVQSPKKIIISVTSDLVTDQRVHKVAMSLHKAGFEVLLFGREKKESAEIEPREYKVKRTRLLFEKGFLFYANYNLRLFFFLLFNKSDILLSNDLDTLFPNYLISRLFRRKLIYDTHEYFTGVPELLERPMIQNIWKKLEKYILPKLAVIYTVNGSIANLYKSEYWVNMHVVRNLPLADALLIKEPKGDIIPANRFEMAAIFNPLYQSLKLEKRPIIIYQGAVNKDRGLEEMIDAMPIINDACLLIIGGGDVFKSLKLKVQSLKLEDRVIMTGPLSFQYLPYFTRLARIGISIEKPTNINYKLASPNKVVDYIHAEVPVLASRLIEVEKIISYYKTGTYIESHSTEHIAEKVNEMLKNPVHLAEWKHNCIRAANELTWQHEEKVLLPLFNQL
jgi:glycosyltransferase involved in cell wall biosynthesis